MNAVLAVARNRKAIAQASMWITRLDRSDPSSVTARFYKLDNNDAMKVATILNEVFVGEEGATGDSAASQLAPGAKSNASKLNSLNAGSSNEAASNIGATDRATRAAGRARRSISFPRFHQIRRKVETTPTRPMVAARRHKECFRMSVLRLTQMIMRSSYFLIKTIIW